MTTLSISETNSTPGIELRKGNILFRGKAISPGSLSIFEAASTWIDFYLKIPANHTIVNINFEYIDSSSTQKMFSILKTLIEKTNKGEKLDVNWLYDLGDLEMLQLGELIQARLDKEFDFIEMEKQQ